MNILLLIILTCFILYFSYVLSGNDIFSPSVLVCATYLAGLCCCFTYRKEWELILDYRTCAVIVFVLVSFFFWDCIIYSHYKRKRKAKVQSIIKQNKKAHEYYHDLSYMELIVFLLIEIACLYPIIKELVAGKSLDALIALVGDRRASAYYSTNVSGGQSFIMSQLQKITNVSMLVFIYLLIQNRMLKIKTRKNIFLICLFVLSAIVSLLSGARATLLKIVISAMGIIYFMILKRKEGKRKIASSNLARRLVFIVPMVLIAFWGLRLLMGRGTRLDSWNFFEYISFYIGGGIAELNDYLIHPLSTAKLTGQETFAALYAFLSKFNSSINVTRNLEFRRIGTINGNVYTAFRRYHSDFGFLGAFFLQTIFCIFYSIWYQKVQINSFKYDDDSKLKTLIYCYLFYPLPYHVIDDQLFSNLLSSTMFLNIIILIIIWKCVLKKRPLLSTSDSLTD